MKKLAVLVLSVAASGFAFGQAANPQSSTQTTQNSAPSDKTSTTTHKKHAHKKHAHKKHHKTASDSSTTTQQAPKQ